MKLTTCSPLTVAELVLKQYGRDVEWPWQREDVLRILERIGATQRQLAFAMQATESQVSDWLRGRDDRTPSFETRVRMDAALARLVEDWSYDSASR